MSNISNSDIFLLSNKVKTDEKSGWETMSDSDSDSDEGLLFRIWVTFSENRA